jgi:hypothetical protein
MLAPATIRRRGVFQPALVAKALEDHFEARANNLPLIWSLLSFEAWCDRYGFFGGKIGASTARAPAAALTS